MRTDSQALAASTTARALAWWCLPVVRSMKLTPLARPRGPSITS